MPQINDENLLLATHLEEIKQKLGEFEIIFSADSYYSKLTALTPLVERFDVTKCGEELVHSFMDKTFEPLMARLGQKKYIESDRMKSNIDLVKILLQKAIQVFSVNKKYSMAVRTLKHIFKNRDNHLFYSDNKGYYHYKSSASPHRERDDKQLPVSQFYVECTSLLRDEFFSFIKQIWNMSIEQITELIDLFVYLQRNKNKKTYNTQLLQAYFSEFLALIQSGREKMLQFAHYQKIVNLSETYSRAQQLYRNQTDVLVTVLAKTLLAQEGKHRLAAVKLLNKYAKKVYDTSYYSDQQKFKQHLQKSDIFTLLLNKDFTQEEFEEANFLFKFFMKTSCKTDKSDFLLKLLKDKVKNQKWFVKLCFKELNVYSLESQQKSAILKFLEELPNISQCYVDYSECIDDLLYKQDSYQCQPERLFKLLSKLMKQAYIGLNETNKRKLMHNFKTSTKGLKAIIIKLGREQKNLYLKQYVAKLLQNIDTSSIIIFNVVFEDSDIRNNYANTDFQSIINYIIEELHIFDKVFLFLENNKNVEQINKEVVRLIKYVSLRCSIKIDVTDKYIKTLANFPEIYQSLIANQAYGKIKSQMEKVFDLFRQEPNLPFHILKTTFLRGNYKRISTSEMNKVTSILQNKQQQTSLKCHPKDLEWYEQLVSLLEQTNNSKLRHQIAQFLVLLSINYTPLNSQYNVDEIKYMNQILQYFLQNTKNYRAKKASKNLVLANLQMIIQMIQGTDILGVSAYKPHNSLVSTSTITLTILNNVTFGDDVQKSFTRNFPVNMVLFDLLAVLGQEFKCGPQDIVLRQGSRFIPILYNGRVLQDLNFTNQDIIAEKNEVNMTKTPEIFIKTSKKDELSEVYVRSLREVFNRFAYEGKMGQIECMNYLRQVGDTYISSSDRKLKQIMDQFDKDNDGILTFDDFLSYNTNKLTGYSSHYFCEQFKRGLFNLRYRKNMTLYNEPLDISGFYNMMMRCRIAKESSVYASLFKYSEDQDMEIADKAKQLLLYLPTWQSLKQNTVQLGDFSNKPDFLIFYKLILIENELSLHRSGLSQQENKVHKKEKIVQFINNKYNQLVFQLMLRFYSQINSSPFLYKCFTLCLKILRSLIDIDNLIQTKIQNLKYSPDSIHSLPQTNFFGDEIAKALSAKNSINFEVLLVLQLTQKTIDLSLIIQNCFHNDQEIRKACCNFIYLWEEKTGWKDDLFEVKISEFNMIEWFDLLCIIIQKTDRFQLKKVLSNTIDILSSRQQTLYKRYDQLMHGYLKILKVILAKSKQLEDPKPLQILIEKLLFKTISSQNRALLYDILTILKKQVMIEYFNDMLTNTLPSQQCEIRTKYVGLKNLGAICYINSIIQQFFMIQKFRYLVLNRSVPSDCKEVEVNGKVLVDDLMYQLQKMYQNLHSSQKKYYVPKEFCFSYKDFDGKPINTSIQQDSHQFLNRLIENVEQACKKDGNLHMLKRLCEVKTLSQYECGECKNRIDKIQNHYSCMLEVKEQDSLAQSLKKFNQIQQIEGYSCDNCQKKVKKISKKTYLHELPEVVILNLQRIIYDQKKGDKIKVHSALTFPLEINFEQFMKHSNLANMKAQYRLKGVVIHTGTSEGGHYYSLIRDSRSQKWFKFNDQTVIEFDQKQIAREGFGGFEAKDNQFQEVTYSTNAYILFYENMDVKKVDYIEAENNLSEEVQNQNQRLIKEIQVHQESFFLAITQLYEKHRPKNIENMMKNQIFLQNTPKQPEKQILQKLLEIHQKAFSFLSVFSGVRPEVKIKISKYLQELYFLLPQQSNKYFKELNMGTFFQNLISHSDAIVRQGLKDLFIKNLNIFFNYYGIESIERTQQREESVMVMKMIEFLMSLLTDNLLYSNMNKSAFFFVLLLQLEQMNSQIKCILMKRGLYFKMLDLLMGRQSFYMKYHPKAQDLPSEIVVIVLEIINKMIPYKKNIKLGFIKKQNIDLNFETTNLQAKILMSPTFYRRIFRLHYNHHLLIPIICLYSFVDIDYTILISDLWLQQINKNDQYDLELLFMQLHALLTIEDNFRQLRWSFLVGVPQYTQVRHNCFCLDYSDKSENTFYISGLYPNKDDRFRFQSDRKPLLQIIFGQKNYRIQNLVLYSLQLFITLAQALQDFFEYILNIPPPNYHKMSLFELVPQIAQRLLEDQDFILDKKISKLNLIITLSQIIEQKLKVHPQNLPVKKYIIGKNKDTEEVSKLEDGFIAATLRRYDTYVLDNIPLGFQNKSMPKHFNEGRGLSSLFLDSKSSLSANTDKIEGKKVLPTVYVFKGKTKHKNLLRFTNKIFNYTILLNQGDFNINTPFQQKGAIPDLVNLEVYKDLQFQQTQQELKNVFAIQEEVKKVEANGKMVEQKNEMTEGKIECPNCTLLNELTSQRCQVCDSPLFM